ncbi:MAG: phosphopantetheine-binding protein [Proteobacteria bacterium]|jgi:acyl carrier protein|nr:phosphopantetheine-binding protein [Pseudomonadota bacterium]
MSHLDRVRGVIADALCVDLDTVTPEANLMRDFGAESIDFLDIMFRLEKEFHIEIPKGDIERRARGNLSDAEFSQDGKLTEAALANVRQIFPEAKPEEIHPGLLFRDLPTLFTVTSIVNMVNHRLAEARGGAEIALGAAQPEAGAAL